MTRFTFSLEIIDEESGDVVTSISTSRMAYDRMLALIRLATDGLAGSDTPPRPAKSRPTSKQKRKLFAKRIDPPPPMPDDFDERDITV